MSEVLIISKDPAMQIRVPLGPAAPTLPGAGLGGWTSTPVIEDEALTTWEGQTQLAQDLNLMLDGWGLRPVSQQPTLDKIYRLALVRPNADPPSPPPFRVFGPVRFPGRWWVLPEGGIELSTDEDEVILDDDGGAIRQALTLHMIAFNGGKNKRRPRRVPIGHPDKTGGTAYPGKHYVTRKGDTFMSVAIDLFGEWQYWKELAKKNPKYPPHPKLPLPVGVALVL